MKLPIVERLLSSFRYLLDHRAFRDTPLRVAWRVVVWEVIKVLGDEPVVAVHSRSRMRLTPGRRRGIHGLVFAFREGYEPGVRAAIDQFVEPGAIAYDVGANIGLWTLRMSERVGCEGRVFAFEPVPANARRLVENLALSGANNVTVHDVALTDTVGSADIYVPYDPGRASLAAETTEDEVFRVETRTLDQCWESHGSPHVAFIKMDVEGAEPMVMAGAGRFLEVVRPIIACEVNPSKLAALTRTPDDIYRCFSALGYRVLAWDEETAEFVPAPAGASGDVVFIPDEVSVGAHLERQ